MKTYELSLTKTEYLITTIEAETPEEAVRMCKEHHEPADVEIHAVSEITPEPTASIVNECRNCRYEVKNTIDHAKHFLGCAHPENTGPNAPFWSPESTTNCFQPIVSETAEITALTEPCASCGGEMLTDGVSEWCSMCSKLEPVE